MDKPLAAHLADVRAGTTAFIPEIAFSTVWAAIAPILMSVGKQAALGLLQMVVDRVQKWEAPPSS